MKLWEKVYLIIMVLFLVVLNTCNILVFRGGYEKSVDSVEKTCVSQWNNMAVPFTEDLAETGGDAAEEWELFQTYVSFCATDDLGFELWKGEELRAKSRFGTQSTYSASEGSLRSDFLTGEGLRKKVLDDRTGQVQILNLGEEKYSCTSGPLLDQDYRLVIYGRVTETLDIWKGQMVFFIVLELAASVLMAFLLYFVIRRFLRPVSDISEAAARISTGDFQYQLSVKGKDELAQLAEDINQMARQVRQHMEHKEREVETKQEFIDALSHELRTPVTSIRGYAQLLLGARLPEDKSIQYLDYIVQESGRVIGITETLRQVILMRQEGTEKGEIFLAKLKEILLRMAEIQFQGKKVAVQVIVRGEEMEGDQTLTELFFTNLLRNSYHACRPGGTIRIELAKTYAVVEDDGTGMSKECLEHIFEPFYREDKSRSRELGGTGLGMYLCHQIAQIQGWEMTIESEKGKGTKIFISYNSFTSS